MSKPQEPPNTTKHDHTETTKHKSLSLSLPLSLTHRHTHHSDRHYTYIPRVTVITNRTIFVLTLATDDPCDAAAVLPTGTAPAAAPFIVGSFGLDKPRTPPVLDPVPLVVADAESAPSRGASLGIMIESAPLQRIRTCLRCAREERGKGEDDKDDMSDIKGAARGWRGGGAGFRFGFARGNAETTKAQQKISGLFTGCSSV